MATREEDYGRPCSPPPPTTTYRSSPNLGKVYVRRRAIKIPRGERSAWGKEYSEHPVLDPGEVSPPCSTAGASTRAISLMMTRAGNREAHVPERAFKTSAPTGIRARHPDDGDELIAVRQTDGGQCIHRHPRRHVHLLQRGRPSRRSRRGRGGIRPAAATMWAPDCLAGTDLSVTENGYGKRTPGVTR